MKKYFIFAALCLLFCGCADKIPPGNIVGFWHGFWHGSIIGIAWIWSWFDSSVAIYASYNNGFWYDFGFILGIGSITAGTKHTVSSL